MDGVVQNVILVTILLNLCLIQSGCYNFVPEFDVTTNTSLNLTRLKRQTTSCIGSEQFQCTNIKECIDQDKICDGSEDCQDGTDETKTLCNSFPCADYLFRCDYGACISGDQRCDGIKNCRDNSDEVGCPKAQKINTNCRSDEFECENGQCISIDGKCNGTPQCEDKSDETESLCLNFFCPGYAYKCKYGACVNGDSECNNIKDCYDNSDEDEKNCGNVILPVISTDKPTESPVQPPLSGTQCITPSHPTHGSWNYVDPSITATPNVKVSAGTVITFSCDNEYGISIDGSTVVPQNVIVLCLNGKWSYTSVPQCLRLCPPVYNSQMVTVSCLNKATAVPCDRATDATILTFECAPYYEPDSLKSNGSICYAGTWSQSSPKCVPVCGEKRVSATPLIVGGQNVTRGNYPWTVALYSNKDTEYFVNQCGGSLIKTDIVITAAHCVTRTATGKAYNPKYYRVGAGKYYNKYEDPRDNDTAQYREVEMIIVHDDYRGEIQYFRADIALLKLKTPFALSKVVQPVCYEQVDSMSLREKDVGVVTGFGYTESSGRPSDILKEVELPYQSTDRCFDEFEEEWALKYVLADKMCAGYLNRNITVCKGDSGGGLMFKNNRNRYFIQGIVSLAHSVTSGSCNIQRRGLFTKVGYYYRFIDLNVVKLSKA